MDAMKELRAAYLEMIVNLLQERDDEFLTNLIFDLIGGKTK